MCQSGLLLALRDRFQQGLDQFPDPEQAQGHRPRADPQPLRR